MSTEEKAKRYDEALKVIKECIPDENGFITIYPQEMFPELKESEDERIRKALVEMVHYTTCENLWVNYNVYKKDALTWLEKQEQHKKFRDSIQVGDKVTKNEDGVLVNLSQLNRVAKKDEKQGEQKPADKVEPKFKVGDWITNNINTNKIIGIDIKNEDYLFENSVSDISLVDSISHLWTIQDAKDGDVLVASDGSIFILKDTIDCACKHYVAITTDNVVKFNEGLEHYWETSTAVHPATKEQRNLLFQKMKEAGYKWDAEKKELKKIEQPKQDWSEEDENNILFLTSIIEECFKDKEKITLCSDTVCAHFTKENVIDRLKSLRPQKQWKPTEEQMRVLECAYGGSYLRETDREILGNLYDQLKEL